MVLFRPVLPVRPRRTWSLNQLISTSMMLEIKLRCEVPTARYLTMHQNLGVVSRLHTTSGGGLFL